MREHLKSFVNECLIQLAIYISGILFRLGIAGGHWFLYNNPTVTTQVAEQLKLGVKPNDDAK